MADNKIKVGPLSVNFKTGLRPDGEVTRINLNQYGQMIQLTPEQAISLAREILTRTRG